MDFALNEEQLEHKDNVRRFSREVIRPVAAKHDADESTPWEVIKEARKWGLQGLEHMQRMGSDPDGQFGVITAEELHWGCAGIALAISGLRPRRRRPRRLRHPRADRRVGPAVLRHRRRDQARRLRGHRAAGRLRRQEPADHRQARRRRVGPERHQGLHHQRRHRRRPRRRRHRRPRARPPRPGLLRDRQGHPGPAPGQEGVEDRHPRLATPPRSSSRTAGSRSSSCSAAWTSSTRSSSAPARARSPAPPTRSRPSR